MLPHKQSKKSIAEQAQPKGQEQSKQYMDGNNNNQVGSSVYPNIGPKTNKMDHQAIFYYASGKPKTASDLLGPKIEFSSSDDDSDIDPGDHKKVSITGASSSQKAEKRDSSPKMR